MRLCSILTRVSRRNANLCHRQTANLSIAAHALQDAPTSGFVDQKPLTHFKLSDKSVANLEAAGITHLFPVQTESFELMMDGKDLLGRSKTGSGKTLAFALPIVEKINAVGGRASDPQALVLLPTRELAQQVSDEMQRVAPHLKTVTIVGGMPYQPQENALRRGAHIVVGTPGRVIDLLEKDTLRLDQIHTSVLDEADMMLKFGFQEAVETILDKVPADTQSVLWSATMPRWVKTLANKFLKSPVHLDLVGDEDAHVPSTVSNKAIHAPKHSRLKVLGNVIRRHAKGGQTLVFTETKQEADEISNELGKSDVRSLHGDLSQGIRTSTMKGFRDGSVRTLVCTDIAARGLDIANVELVVQFRLPSDRESFVHRAGRTGRAGRDGTNIVFFDRDDSDELRHLEKKYHVQFAHAAPPHVEQVLDDVLTDVAQQLCDVPQSTASLFQPAAERMLEEQGPNALGQALAMLCGFDNKRVNAISMLTGRLRMETIEISNFDGGMRELKSMLEGIDTGDANNRSPFVHAVGDKYVLDVPAGGLGQVQEELESSGEVDAQASLVTELPQLLLASNLRRENRSNNRFDRSFSRGNNRSQGGRGDRPSRPDDRRNRSRSPRDHGNRRNSRWSN